ncbi:hypothetical protein [Hymenobacter crusticola]|nr:hypothetical protein [Hymenobacter crusticola]
MRNISPEHPAQLLPDASGILPASQPSISRRLMSIRIALQLSGTPPLSTVGHILLARYVAGHISLADLIPRLL